MEEKKRAGGRFSALAARYGYRLPKAGEERILLVGDRRVTAFGCRKILSYAPDRIALRLSRRVLSVEGSELCFQSFSVGCVTVEGVITGLRLESDGKGRAR